MREGMPTIRPRTHINVYRFRRQNSGGGDGTATQKHQIRLLTMQTRNWKSTLRISLQGKSYLVRLEPTLKTLLF
jgi:hypothetical protein